MRLAAVVVVVACSSAPKPAPAPAPGPAPDPAPIAVTPTPPPDAAPAAPIDAAPVTTFHVGDVASVPSRHETYDVEQALAGTGCLAVPLQEVGNDAVLASDVGTVVAVSTTCPGHAETVAVQVRDSVVAADATSMRRLDAACLPAIATMYTTLIPAWDRCRAKSRWKHDLAAVNVRFTSTGTVDDVAYQGGTGWGPKVAQCIIDTTKRAKLDGRACAGETIRLSQLWW